MARSIQHAKRVFNETAEKIQAEIDAANAVSVPPVSENPPSIEPIVTEENTDV